MDMMKPLILAVDDTTENLDILVESLGQEYDMMVATDGEDALIAIQEQRPDLILLDIMLPQMYGWEVLEKIKSDVSTQHIPVVMLSARHYLEDEVETKVYADLFSAYIVKPFVVRDLLDKIAGVLGPG